MTTTPNTNTNSSANTNVNRVASSTPRPVSTSQHKPTVLPSKNNPKVVSASSVSSSSVPRYPAKSTISKAPQQPKISSEAFLRHRQAVVRPVFDDPKKLIKKDEIPVRIVGL
jgi:hypothetical protein